MKYVFYLIFTFYVFCTEQKRHNKEYYGPKTTQLLREQYAKEKYHNVARYEKEDTARYNDEGSFRTINDDDGQMDPDAVLCYDYCWDCYCAEWDDYYCRDCGSCAALEWKCDRHPIPVPRPPPYYPPPHHGDDDDDNHRYDDDYVTSNYRNYQPIEVNVGHSCECNYAPINITEICTPSLVSEQSQAQGQNSTNANALNNSNSANTTVTQRLRANTTQDYVNSNEVENDMENEVETESNAGSNVTTNAGSNATSNAGSGSSSTAASAATSGITITLDLSALLLENLIDDNLMPFFECDIDCEYYMMQCISVGFADCANKCNISPPLDKPTSKQDTNQCAQCFQNQTQACFEFDEACKKGCSPKYLSMFRPTSERAYNQKAAFILKTLKEDIDAYYSIKGL